jgi:hypothetical protein
MDKTAPADTDTAKVAGKTWTMVFAVVQTDNMQYTVGNP